MTLTCVLFLRQDVSRWFCASCPLLSSSLVSTGALTVTKMYTFFMNLWSAEFSNVSFVIKERCTSLTAPGSPTFPSTCWWWEWSSCCWLCSPSFRVPQASAATAAPGPASSHSSSSAGSLLVSWKSQMADQSVGKLSKPNFYEQKAAFLFLLSRKQMSESARR